MSPSFSIIVPVYNSEEFLADCLDSLQRQDYGNYEIICIDDGSTDNSQEILQKYSGKDNRIKVFHQENSGLSCARNAGLSKAIGDWVMFVDSDDAISSTCLSTIAATISSNPDIDIVAFEATLTQSELSQTPSGKVSLYDSGWAYWESFIVMPNNPTFTCVWSRAYRRSFMFDNRLSFLPKVYHEDNHFTPICCYHANKVAHIPDNLYYYRIHGGSIMTGGGLEKHAIDMAIVANNLSVFFLDKKVSPIVFNYIAYLYRRSIFYSNKSYDRALKDTICKRSYWEVSRLAGKKRRLFYYFFLISPSLCRSAIQFYTNLDKY